MYILLSSSDFFFFFLWTKIKGWQVGDKACWKLNVQAVMRVCIQKKAWNWPIDYALFLCSMRGFVTKPIKKLFFSFSFPPLSFTLLLFLFCVLITYDVFLFCLFLFIIIILHKISVGKLSVWTEKSQLWKYLFSTWI